MQKRVLVVDDEPNIVLSVQFLLKRQGLDVLTAGDGEAGLAEIRRTLPSLVILDVMMPKLDGFAVLEAMRKDPQLSAIPVLMLTARGRDTDRKKGLALGADAYVSKPFSTHELVDKALELLR